MEEKFLKFHKPFKSHARPTKKRNANNSYYLSQMASQSSALPEPAVYSNFKVPCARTWVCVARSRVSSAQAICWHTADPRTYVTQAPTLASCSPPGKTFLQVTFGGGGGGGEGGGGVVENEGSIEAGDTTWACLDLILNTNSHRLVSKYLRAAGIAASSRWHHIQFSASWKSNIE